MNKQDMEQPLVRKVLPVVHHLNEETSLSQADLAFKAGADGIFLISHDGRDNELVDTAKKIKSRYNGKIIGINFLGYNAITALNLVTEAGLDAVWSDSPGVRSDEVSSEAYEISNRIRNNPDAPLFFGSVAFKYQPEEPDPSAAAIAAENLGMIPTTSGAATGSAPSVSKIQAMFSSVKGNKLAIASGMTLGNVSFFTPYVSYYLVATGLSVDMHHFDEAKLKEFVSLVHSYNSH